MRVILINPPQIAELFFDVYLPLNLAYIASYLKKHGHDVKIIDLQIQDTSIIKDEIKSFKPQFVGITSMTPNFPISLKISKMVKRLNKNVKIIFGGIHATSLPKETLKNDSIDFVIIGEGEDTIVKLLDSIENKSNLRDVKGICFKEKSKIIINSYREPVQDLDNIPFPAYELLDMNKYKKYSNAIMVITSRGCPFNCIFCASSLIHGKKIRRRSIDNVLDELKFLKNSYGVKRVAFYDDTFTIDKQYAITLFKRLIEDKMDMKWWCNTRVDTVDKEIIGWMEKSGCVEISYGFESGNQRILDYIKKGITIEQSNNAIETTKNTKIDMHGFFIINFPYETKKEMRNTINFARRMPLKWFRLTLATPYPGTELYNICIKNKLISGKDLNDWEKYNYLREFYIYNPNITEKDLKRMLKQSNILLILNLTYIRNIFKRLFIRIIEGDFNAIIRGFKYVRNILSIK